MGLFFKNSDNQEEKTNSYLEDQQAVFNTIGDKQPEKFNDSYDEYIYKPKDYSDIPKYHATDKQKIDIVIDKDDFGYEDIKPEVKTVNVQKKDLHEDISEFVNNAPIDDSLKDKGISIYDDELKDQIKKDDSIEIIDIDDSEKVVSDVVEEDIDKSKKLSIFGNSDEPIQAKVYDVKTAPPEGKIDIVDPFVTSGEEKEEAKDTTNEKFCSQCGAPLSPTATTCFLCGKKL